jgi:beta-lactamase regulating signal transducer with metallopeptidase domain
MNDLFMFALHNSIMTILLALLVATWTRVWRNPPAQHLLWVLVLLRLVAPPIVGFDPMFQARPAQTAEDQPLRPFVTQTGHSALDEAPTAFTSVMPTTANDPKLAPIVGRLWNHAPPALLSIWLGGILCCTIITASRIVQFERQLRDTLPASGRITQMTLDLSARLGLPRAPDVRYLSGAEIPFAWCVGRHATVVLPMRWLEQADDQAARLVLTHELAHLRRRDHVVRVLESIVSTIYWWNPLVWFIRKQIHQAEDLCCDAWVRRAFPDSAVHYAQILLEFAESASLSRQPARLPLASPFLRPYPLKARIQMLLESRFTPRLSRKSTLLIALLALLVLPVFARHSRVEARPVPVLGDDQSSNSSVKPSTPASSEFPFVVKFEQGATRFEPGDDIKILEIRGTAETFTTGNIYWIKGKYTLASHGRATIAAYTTAMDAANGKSTPLKVQRVVVDKGDGTFTLFLPMTCRGWPHVSFYPDKGGSDFGGNHFGTGDSVLKRWWGS